MSSQAVFERYKERRPGALPEGPVVYKFNFEATIKPDPLRELR